MEQEYNFKIDYQNRMENGKADVLSRCPEFTAREGGTISTEKNPPLGPKYWIDIGFLNLENEDDEEIVLSGF
jgi:hypothetical protein